jgi:hypothetical protein
MSDNSSTTTQAAPVKPGNTDWRSTLKRSADLKIKAGDEGKKASRLLWDGAKSAITEWVPDSDTDAGGEGLYVEVMTALGGKTRKGDASKVKTVALAVKNNGLVLSAYPNLFKAYGEAKRLTTTAQAHAAEDTALDTAVKALEDSAPKSASTPENAAKIVLAQGPAKAAALLLDALGTDESAHRAFVRALAQEAASRIKPKAKAVKAAPKAGAKQAKSGGTPQATAKKATAPAKPKGAAAKAAQNAPAKAAPAVAKPKVAAPAAVKAPAAPAVKAPAVKPRPSMVSGV